MYVYMCACVFRNAFKDSPDCCHDHPNHVPSFVPNNWPECLINMLAYVCAYTLSRLLILGLVLFAVSILIPASLRATYARSEKLPKN